jgi:hypothetical protein
VLIDDVTYFYNILSGGNTMPVSLNMIRLPSDLVRRAEAQWDRLMEIPSFRAAAPRRSGAAAVRMLLQWKLEELEAGNETTERGQK